MTTTRKQYSPKFKGRVALEAIRAEKTLSRKCVFSGIDDSRKEEGTLEEVQTQAILGVLAWRET